jgi:hypothetical protein
MDAFPVRQHEVPRRFGCKSPLLGGHLCPLCKGNQVGLLGLLDFSFMCM